MFLGKEYAKKFFEVAKEKIRMKLAQSSDAINPSTFQVFNHPRKLLINVNVIIWT